MDTKTKKELEKVVEEFEKLADEQNEYIEEGERNKSIEQSSYYQGKRSAFFNAADLLKKRFHLRERELVKV